MEVENSKWVRGKMIGKGSYGSVCVGIRESDGGRFAVKTASKQSLQSLESLENEIKILRSLSSSSPFIVEYYGDDETTSHRNLHLEYLPGGDVARIGGVDVELIRSYAWCLVKALKEVHSKGVVHCDIKGSNVLVGPTHGVVKLADFGSSKFVNDQEFQDQRCKIVPRGSPLWMAPEAVRGEAQGFESDIWSYGCTVIEMFTGVPAWQDNGARTLFKIGYSSELPEYPKNVSELGRDFLDKCLNRNPEQRWSCDQLLQHPFLVPVTVSKITESTPRSILDWNNLDFSDDEEESTPSSSLSSWCDGLLEGESSARDRVGKLASTVMVNWESDGWEEVRCLRSKKEEEVSEGTSSEYSDFEGVNWTIPTWINLSSSSNDDNDERSSSVSGADGGGGRCGHGDSCGGGDMIDNNSNNNIDEREEILLFLKSVLFLLVVLYSFTRNTRNKSMRKYDYLFVIFIFLSSWSYGASSSNNFRYNSIIVYFECLNEFTNQKVNTKSKSIILVCCYLPHSDNSYLLFTTMLIFSKKEKKKRLMCLNSTSILCNWVFNKHLSYGNINDMLNSCCLILDTHLKGFCCSDILYTLTSS